MGGRASEAFAILMEARGMWRRIRPLSLLMFAFLVTMPWQLKLYKAFELNPSTWLMWGAWVVVAAVWLGASYWSDFASAEAREKHSVAVVATCVVLGVIGLTTAFLSNTIYTGVRFAAQRQDMERFVAGEGPCPAMRCMRDGDQQVGFVWGANSLTWSGACFDGDGALEAAERAGIEDRTAERPRQARLYGGVVTRANPISGQWRRCSVSKVRLGEAH